MGQIVGTKSNIFRCNLAAIQSGGSKANTILAADEVWLVDTTNSLTNSLSGNCDAYIVGNGSTAATELELHKFKAEELDVQINGIPSTTESITLPLTAGTSIIWPSTNKMVTLKAGRVYHVTISGSRANGTKFTSYYRKGANNTAAYAKTGTTLAAAQAATGATTFYIQSYITEYYVIPSEDIGMINFYAGSSDIKDTTELTFTFAYESDNIGIVGELNEIEAKIDSPSFVPVATKEKDEYDLALTDENRYAVAIFKDGHIKTKNFDSSKLENDPTEYAYTYEGEKISFGRQNYLNVSLLFTITPGSRGATQGCACYGGYLFAANDYMSQISIYDLSTNQLVNVITFEENTQLHCNTIAFGRWKYNDADFSPCLYISQENANHRKCMVFQVTYNGSAFSLTKVQEIHYPTLNGSGLYYPNCMIDAQNGVMYIMSYSTNSFQQDDATKLIILKYNLPLPSAGDVTLLESGLLDKKEVPSEYATQGGFINYGKLYQVFGAPPQTYLIVRQVGGDWTLCNRIPLSTIGIAYEPEATCFNDDNLFIIDVANQVFKLTFKA